jgi:hypothetical protein
MAGNEGYFLIQTLELSFGTFGVLGRGYGPSRHPDVGQRSAVLFVKGDLKSRFCSWQSLRKRDQVVVCANAVCGEKWFGPHPSAF